VVRSGLFRSSPRTGSARDLSNQRKVAARVVADYVGASIATIDNWRRDPVHPFPAATSNGKTCLDQVDRWLRERDEALRAELRRRRITA